MKKIVIVLLTFALIFSCAAVICAAEREGAFPQITFLTPINGGFKINFSACENAAAYKVFTKTAGGWKLLGTTADTSFDYTGLRDAQNYTFTVRGIDKNGAYSTAFDEAGFTQTYYAPPVLRTLTCTQAGMKLTWDKIEGIDYYDVYVKNPGEAWRLLMTTFRTYYIDTSVQSGKTYTYTVKGMSKNGLRNLTFHDTKGISRTYVAAPKITGFQNLAGGTKLTWKSCSGASAYRVLFKTAGGWKKLADTTACSFTHKGLKNNTAYTYTIRAINKAGKYVSGYYPDGSTNTFYSVPVLTEAVPVYGGIRVNWKPVAGVGEYLVFVKTASGWKQLAVCDTTTFIQNNVVSGKTYTYTVRCSANEGTTALSGYNAKGIRCTYVAAPEITGFENGNGSVKIYIRKTAGAYQYRVFAKAASGWKAIATTKTLTAVHKGVKNNTQYRYTVRALNKSGKYISAYNPAGKVTRYFAPPVIRSVTPGEGGNTLSWEANELVGCYRIYKKSYGDNWAFLADTDQTAYTDTAVQSNVPYTYTLRYLNAEKHSLSFYAVNTAYYYNGALANGTLTYAGKALHFTDGFILQGLQKRDGKYYFYNSAGFLQKGGIVGNAKQGYYYADKTGAIDFTFRDGVKQNNTQWLVLNGKAGKVTSEYDQTLYRAFMLLKECTNSKMTKEQKLYASFRYLQKITTEMNPRIPHYTGKNWHLMYANDIFVNRKGNCMSYGAAFAFMAKAIGYEDVYACNSGGHGWAEVNHLVYDPEWDIHHKNSFYGISYDVNCGNDYKGAIAAGYWWMRVAI